MMNARILKGVGGYYTVRAEDGTEFVLKARGRFRHDDQTPLPGDFVAFDEPKAGEEGAMSELLPRKNMLVRPQVANIDLLCAVVSATLPEPDYLLLDKLCANAALIGVEAICLMNKADQADETAKQAFLTDYAAFVPHLVSAKTGEGLDALRTHFSNKTVCFAGQSGVGKSSLLNRLMPQRERQTAKLSERGSRGKHTTRVAELVAIEGGGMLVDTPGFSLMELPLMPPEDLKSLYPELEIYEGKCRFLGCLHHTEPGCAAKAAIGRGGITQGRYDRYISLLIQMQQRWRNRYE